MRPPLARRGLAALLVGCLTVSLLAAPAAAATRETTITYDGDRLTVVPLADQPVEGTTDLDPGTELVVELRTGDGAFVYEAQATVTESGMFTARIDFGEMRPGATFRVVVRGPDGERLTAAEGVVEPLSGTDTAIEYDGDLLTVEAAPNQTVAGTSDLPAGTTLTLRVRSAGGTPFLKQATATVDDAGRFAADLDFGGVEPGTSFTVTVVETETSVDGVVGGEGVGVPPETEPALAQSIVRLAPPDTATWNVSVGDGETFLAVGDDDPRVVGLVDADDDGEVTVVVDGSDVDAAPRLRVAAPDRYEVVRQGSPPPLSAAEQYDVRLSTAVGGETVDVGTLVVDGTATASDESAGTPTTPTPSFLERNAVGIAGVVAVLFGLLALGRARR